MANRDVGEHPEQEVRDVVVDDARKSLLAHSAVGLGERQDGGDDDGHQERDHHEPGLENELATALPVG